MERDFRLKKEIETRLDEMDLQLEQVIQIKNGVHVYKVSKENTSRYFKYFEHDKDALEIACYQALGQVGVKTIPWLDYRENCLLLVDMTSHTGYRLGQANDFLDGDLIDAIGSWFKNLHAKSIETFDFLPTEAYVIEEKQIEQAIAAYGSSEFFSLLEENRTLLNTYFNTRKRVVSHGDFYWKNFFVEDSKQEVIMFDFNYMTKGIASEELSLIRRNLRSASPNSEARFIASYGSYDTLEYTLYELYRHFSCLIAALNYDQMPSWAAPSITDLEDGHLAAQLCSCMPSLQGQ